MFQNVLMTTLAPLSDLNEINCWQNKPFTGVWPSQQQKTNDITKTIKKKNKRSRTSYTTEQLKLLEKTFKRSKYIDNELRRELSKVLGLGEKCIKIWFQNRRMKEKRASSESSCDSSSEIHADSVQLSPSVQKRHVTENRQPSNYKTDNVISYEYCIGEDNEQKYSTQNRFATCLTDHENLDYSIPYSLLCNDVNIYATQCYPNTHNEYTYSSTTNNQYFAYNNNTQTWLEGSCNYLNLL